MSDHPMVASAATGVSGIGAGARAGAGGRIRFYDYHPEPADIRAEVLEGLSRPQKRIPPKFFYDARGSRLFDAICELPEYYPTRTEIAILRTHGAEMASALGRNALLIELGSGSSLKIRVLLDALRPAIYMPVDISKEHLLRSARALAGAFPSLEIHAACADYSIPFELPLHDHAHPRAALFSGSSVGNFDPADARRFLARVGGMLGPGGRLLIGVDLRKDPVRLRAAYNDAQGVTAAFNLNLLRRVNSELGADFNLDCFRHDAFFNDAESRIEMHLVSTTDQYVNVHGRRFAFAEGESIHTENSYKYSVDGFRTLARAAGFDTEQVWVDDQALFSVHCLVWGGAG